MRGNDSISDDGAMVVLLFYGWSLAMKAASCCEASEDAKKLVSQERSFACAEIESARAVVQRFGEALEEQEKNSQASEKQPLCPKCIDADLKYSEMHLITGSMVMHNKYEDVEGLMDEVQEARKIRIRHQPSKVMDMEHELRALRIQIREKSIFSVKLQKELAISKRAEENPSRLYELNGSETLGSYLRIQPCSDKAPELLKCSIQWYRVSSESSKNEPISVQVRDWLKIMNRAIGANKSIYAPEPFDVGRILQADIVSNGQKATVMTTGPIEHGWF
ncbi:Stomatal closure-related actin-binding protein 1 [Vitis vinifera]|uniref:Stomatal closure-related actin-binding protein 1 n=1 Tax=Vitis vinifera TaxID=29760 RepID=A0A438J7Z1_VITVI|nr:Stomatal closure-related actin-binding protein 1 [Vitis vinifera]